MASDQLRKKWGTVFMGEREATVEQLDAMQEPLRRERLQQQQQEDYMARVRAKAEERAREILGAAYAERQKVLEEAKAEALELSRRLMQESETVRAQAQDERNKAQAELDQAQALRQEAQALRDDGHAEGFQAGMDQAGQELKEFRAEMGQALGAVLYALESQRRSICESWRDELVMLMQEAVKAGTGWVLDEEHTKILQSLVFEALNLLEDRATVTVRVHPDDEATVSDMFMAARERVPELQQWIVSGDPSVERGGLLAESVSGSVDCRREHYTELVNGIMSYLTLGPGQDDAQNSEVVSQLVRQEAERIAAMAPMPEQPAGPQTNQPAAAAPSAESFSDQLTTAPQPVDSYADQPAGAYVEADDGAGFHAGQANADAPEGQASPVDSADPLADPLSVAPPFAPSAEPSGVWPDQDFQAASELALNDGHDLPVPDAEALMVEENYQQPVPDTGALMVEEPDFSAHASTPASAPTSTPASGPMSGPHDSPEVSSAAAAQSHSGHDSTAKAQASAANAHSVADHAQGSGLPAQDQAAQGVFAQDMSAQDVSGEGMPPQENFDAAAPSASVEAPAAAARPAPEHEAAPAMPAHAPGSEATAAAARPAPEHEAAPAMPVHAPGSEATAAAPPVQAQAATKGAAVAAPRTTAQIESPTLAELEDELFPLDAEDGLGFSNQPPAPAFDPSALVDLIDRAERGQPDDQDIFSQGGFLPGAQKGR